ncbi:GFA family protein [Pseudomonas xantholysinigenes]|uniref:GFA family protein n=1 Tax=Pseudomonas xantholysinigenes TaxID=2745490 RepID=A0A9E6TV84_9PSED|nr:GFA family protein [Pseudomonas xantholysinigenes]QXI37028.1 GFA family protein [Pseudomonas xantholysinigenes]
MPLEKQGTCLCKATHLNLTLENTHVSACHCSMCRKWTGGPLLAVQCSQPPVIKGPAPSIYDSSPWAERGFCGQCGTHLFYRLKESGLYVVPVGVIDSEQTWTFTEQIFIDEKPTWYCFSNETKNLTGQQVFDQFAPS